MATRSNLDSKILQALKEWESSADSPATVQEIAGEFGVTEAEAFNALGRLEDAGNVTGEGRGLTSTWWIGEPKNETPAPVQDAPKPKRKRRTKAEMEAARAEERKRLEYNTRAAESQDMVMSQALSMADSILNNESDTPEVIPAETPVIAEDGSTVTVPVDYDNPSAGRRELDSSMGERVLSEDTYRVRKSALPRSDEGRTEYVREMEALRNSGDMTPDSIRALIRTLQGMVEDDSPATEFVVTYHEPKNGECPGNPIPPLPKGVNANVWELAHDANTQSARDRWMREAKRQEQAAKSDAPF